MEEITFQVQRDEQSGWLVAWDDPDGAGGITTQGQDLRDLQQQITEAVSVHFDEGAGPRRIRIHFVSDPILVQAWNCRDISGAEALKALERLGFSITRHTGSHVRMAWANRRVTVPMHRNLVHGTLQSILRQAGISVEDFVNAL